MNDITDDLRGIEVTDEAQIPIKEYELVRRDERIKILQDPVRLEILEILKEGVDDTQTTIEIDEEEGERIIREKKIKRTILSVPEIVQISKELEGYEPLSRNQVYHHINKLKDANFVAKYGEIRTGKRTTEYYFRTAENFVTLGKEYPKKFQPKNLRAYIERALSSLKLNLDEVVIEKLLDLLVQVEMKRLDCIGNIEEVVDGDVGEPESIIIFNWLLWICASGDSAIAQLLDDLRSLLFT